MATENPSLKTLFTAIVTGNLSKVASLTTNLKNYSTSHYVILKHAMTCGQIEIAKLLINRGCRLTEKEYPEDNEILHLAIATGSLQLVELIIDKNISTQFVDKDELPPIFNVVQLSFISNFDICNLLDCLLQNGADLQTKLENNGFSILHFAAELGNVSIIPLLIERGADVNAKSNDGSTALHIAVRNSNSAVVEMLLENGAEVTLVDNNNIEPSYLAVQNGDFKILQLLHFYYSNKSLMFRKSAFHLAAENGDIKIAKLLLKCKANLDRVDGNGFTPLHWACMNGHLEIVSALLDTGKCNLNAESNTGWTAIQLAIEKGHSEVVSLILESDANCEIFEQSNMNVLITALENINNRMDILTILLEHIDKMKNKLSFSLLSVAKLIKKYWWVIINENGDSILHIAVQNGDEVALDLLLKYQICVRTVNEDGHTAFDLATINGAVSIANIFLKSAKNPKSYFVPRKNKLTPMHLAVERRDTEMVQLFIQNGISVNSYKPMGITPLHIAVRNSDKNTILLLLKYGAQVDVPRTINFETPLSIASEIGNLDILEILCEAPLSVTFCWEEGYFMMYNAAYRGNYKVVKMLLDRGVDPDANFYLYLTPLHAAAQSGHEDIVKLLIKNGAAVNPKRKSRSEGHEYFSTPLLAASHSKHSEVVRILLENGADANAKLKRLFENHVSESNKVLIQGSYIDSEIGRDGSLVGYTPLHFAVEDGDEERVKFLLKYGANVNLESNRNTTAISLAIEKEDEALVRQLLFAGVDILDWEKMTSILNMEVLKTNTKIAELLVDRLLDYKEEPAMYFAVRNNCATFVKLLIKRGVDVNCSYNGHTVIMVAVIQEFIEIIELLVDAMVNTDIEVRHMHVLNTFRPLIRASLNKNSTIIEIFLEKGFIDTDFKDTFLFPLALKTSNLKIVQILIKYGASIAMKDSKGETSLFFAVRGNNIEVVEYLLKSGVSLRDKNNAGYSILDIALLNNCDVKMFKILLDYGIEIEYVSPKGYTPLGFILQKQTFESLDRVMKISILLEIFLENDANPNQLLNAKKTMLELALERGYPEFVKILLSKGADINKQTSKKKVPLILAYEKVLKYPQIYLDSMANFDKWEWLSQQLEYLPALQITFLLIREVVRQEVISGQIDEQNSACISSLYLENYYQYCKYEINLMKELNICPGITYFDILTANYRKIVTFSKNNDVYFVLLLERKVTEIFPTYAEVLIERIKVGRDRNLLLESSYHLLNKVFRYNFPLSVIEHVSSYLADKDLRNLSSAFKHNMFF